MAPHSSTLAWKIPWMEEPGRLQSMGSWRVRHDWVTSLSLFTFMHWRRNGNPLQCYCLEDPRDGGAWWAAISGVAQSRTRLKWLSSSSVQLINVNLFYWLKLPSNIQFSDHINISWIFRWWIFTFCAFCIYKQYYKHIKYTKTISCAYICSCVRISLGCCCC